MPTLNSGLCKFVTLQIMVAWNTQNLADWILPSSRLLHELREIQSKNFAVLHLQFFYLPRKVQLFIYFSLTFEQGRGPAQLLGCRGDRPRNWNKFPNFWPCNHFEKRGTNSQVKWKTYSTHLGKILYQPRNFLSPKNLKKSQKNTKIQHKGSPVVGQEGIRTTSPFP